MKGTIRRIRVVSACIRVSQLRFAVSPNISVQSDAIRDSQSLFAVAAMPPDTISRPVHYVAVVVDAEFLMDAADAADEFCVPHFAELRAQRRNSFAHDQPAIRVLFAPNTRVRAGDAFSAFARNGHMGCQYS